MPTVQAKRFDRDVMHRRHLYELAGQIEPKSGLEVLAYSRPINFEWQVEQHMKMWREEMQRRPNWPTDAKAKEREVRVALATGQAWLHTEPQMELFDVHNAPHDGPGAASSRTVPLDAVVRHGS